MRKREQVPRQDDALTARPAGAVDLPADCGAADELGVAIQQPHRLPTAQQLVVAVWDEFAVLWDMAG